MRIIDQALLIGAAILGLSCAMLLGLVICSVSASCLCCCRFEHRTITGYALDGQKFTAVGRQRSLNDQRTRHANDYHLVSV